MVNNFIGSLGQDLDQDNNRRFGQFGNQVGNLFSKWKFGNGDKTPWGAIGSTAKSGYNMISDKDDKDYSDLEESIIYPLHIIYRYLISCVREYCCASTSRTK